MAAVFRRPELSSQIAQKLLNPGVLDEGLRSGLFLSGSRRIGKTTFLINDLVPALEAAGGVVIYVDLWSDTQANPDKLLKTAIRETLTDLQNPASTILARLAKLSGAELQGFGFSFGFDIEAVGNKGGITLAKAMTDVVDQAGRDVIIIIDEVQQAMSSDDGSRMLLALKAARDAVNTRPDTRGHFLFVGTGSHRALVNELTARRSQAFAGAVSMAYPVLEQDYVEHLFARLTQEGRSALPSLDVATRAFATVGNRPEEMIKALNLLQTSLPEGGDPDEYLPVIAVTLRSATADIELHRLTELGQLAVAIFDRIANADDVARGVFSVDAAQGYSEAIGRTVKIEEIQPSVNEMLAANLILRTGHGMYGVADPFVQKIWRERRLLES